MIHWSALGGFHKLSDSEKQFLILKSLLIMGGQGGGIFVDASDWFAFSNNFRNAHGGFGEVNFFAGLFASARALFISRPIFGAGRLRSGTKCAIRWDSARDCWPSIDLVLREKNAELLVVDPGFIFTREHLTKLFAWARAGRTLVIPRSALYTEVRARRT